MIEEEKKGNMEKEKGRKIEEIIFEKKRENGIKMVMVKNDKQIEER